MRGNDRGTSTLFFQINKITQAYCLFGQRNRRTKKIQNSTEIKDASVISPSYEVAVASTETLNSLEKEKSINKDYTTPTSILRQEAKRYKPKSSMNRDPIVMFKDVPTQSPKLSKKILKGQKEVIQRDDSTETQRKKKSKMKSYKQPEKIENDDVPSEKPKKRSIVSLYRKRKKSYKVSCPITKLPQTNVKFEIKPKDTSLCHGGPCSNAYKCSRTFECACNERKRAVNEDIIKNKGTDKPDATRKQKNKVTCLCHEPNTVKDEKVENVFAEGPRHHQDICKEGVCVEAIKSKDFSFICKCKTRKQKPITECTDLTCNVRKVPENNKSNTTIVNLRRKIKCLCRKYSQKIRDRRRSSITANLKINEEVCKIGLCREALEKNVKDFKCKCTKKTKIKECTDESCSLKKLNKDKKNNLSEEPDTKIIPKQHSNCRNKSNVRKKCLCLFCKPKRSTEIKNNTQSLEKSKGKKSTSLDKIKQINKVNGDDACLRGLCAKAVKNRKTNFTCKCIRKETLDISSSHENSRTEKTTNLSEKPDITKPHSNCRNKSNIRKKCLCLFCKPKRSAEIKNNTQSLEKSKVKKRTLPDKIKQINEDNGDDSCLRGLCAKVIKNENTNFTCNCIRKGTLDKSSRLENSRTEKNTNLSEKSDITKPHSNCRNKSNVRKKCLCLFCKPKRSAEIKNNTQSLEKSKVKKRTLPGKIKQINGDNGDDSCLRGLCAKAIKNKNTNFTCNCIRKGTLDENKLDQHSKSILNNYNRTKSLPPKPLVKQELDVSCSCNSEESYRTDVCEFGVCKNAIKDENKNVLCRCRVNNDVECTKMTCDTGELQTSKCFIERLCLRCRSRHARRSKTTRKALDTTEIVDGVKSKSENWTTQQKKRRHKSKRTLDTSSAVKWCRGLICSQSDNLQNKKGLKISVKQKNLPVCDCKECKKRKKVEVICLCKETSECGDVLCKNHTHKKGDVNTGSCGVCCKCNQNKNNTFKCRSFICTSFANLRRRRVNTQVKEVRTVTKQTSVEKKKKTPPKKASETICKCHHECQCALAMKKQKASEKNKQKNKKVKKKIKKVVKKKKKPNSEKQRLALEKAIEKRKQKESSNKMLQKSRKGDEKFNKEVRRKEKAERKKQAKLKKQQIKELERLSQGKEQMHETSCCADFILGILTTTFKVVKTLAFVIFRMITQPKVSLRYVKMRAQDPIGTYERIRKWANDSWQLKKLEMAKTVGGSEAMSVLSDTFKETTVFQAFSNKGKTKKERQKIEQESKKRKRRIKKRHDEAVYGCRHTLLTTLRKTPCLWVYHICPGFYPQCLSLVMFWRNFSNMMLFCLAMVVWTPCILACEMCRALMCCTLCTG